MRDGREKRLGCREAKGESGWDGVGCGSGGKRSTEGKIVPAWRGGGTLQGEWLLFKKEEKSTQWSKIVAALLSYNSYKLDVKHRIQRCNKSVWFLYLADSLPITMHRCCSYDKGEAPNTSVANCEYFSHKKECIYCSKPAGDILILCVKQQKWGLAFIQLLRSW